MLIDDVTITIKAGHGGRGKVSFNNVVKSLGPTGATGGDGGNIIFEGVSNIGALLQFRHKKEVSAENGENGKSQFADGHDGKDALLKVPVGTVIHNVDTGTTQEVLRIGEHIIGARGGRGGKGNYKFRSAINTSPKQFQPGLPGEEFRVRLELKLIADVGLLGYPNVGKSSLLNTLTHAQSKVANYQFTTLEPHLGVFYELVLADVPGIIEGASEGKGLGIKFLKHIERTRTLFHLISAESDRPLEDYKIIRGELGAYNKELLEKPEYVFISKSDMVSPAELKKIVTALKKKNPHTYPLSILDDTQMKVVKKILADITKKKTA